MDRKTIIAFILIGIILLASQYLGTLFLGKRTPAGQQSQKETPMKEMVSKEEGVGVGQVDTISTGLVQRTHENREITLENDLFLVTMNTRGGTISHIKLKEFEGLAGGRVDLIKPGSEPLGLFLVSDGQVIDMEEVGFTPDKEGLRVIGNDVGRVRFVASLGSGTVEKMIDITGNRYGIGLTIAVQGISSTTKVGFRWKDGIGIAERNRSDDLSHTTAYTFMGGELETVECKKEVTVIDTLDGRIGWIGLRNKYFFVGLAPQDGGEYTVEIERQQKVGGDKHYDIGVSWKTDDGVQARQILLYTGPLVYQKLSEYQLGLERAVDLGWWGIRPFSQGILWLFLRIHKVIPNYGVVLILFALLVKLAVYPLTKKSYESSLKMQELQPKLAALKEKHKGDQAKMGQETMRLYKEVGVNPAGGCLPLLLQMPIFFALYKVFSSTIELRQAHFFWWLRDLSQPDPYYILPVLMGVSMFIQQKMTVKDPKQAMLVYLMPGLMMFFFLNVSSGLVLYWAMFNILSIIQQEFIDKKIYRPQLSR